MVANFKQPQTKTDIRSFWGLAGYYRWYIPNFSGTTAPLLHLTKGSLPDIVTWFDQCQNSFDLIKKTLTSHPTLVPPDYKKLFILQTDALNRGIGTVFIPHAQHERGKAIGCGVHIYICLWTKKIFESYFRDRLTFSNIRSRTLVEFID